MDDDDPTLHPGLLRSENESTSPSNGQTLNVKDVLAGGDLLLDIKSNHDGQPHLLRVSSRSLQSASRYFATLLDSTKFMEGGAVRERHEKLVGDGIRPARAPADLLPRIRISDLGQISWPQDGSSELVHDFLRILHGLEIHKLRPSLAFLADLAVLADRFDCLSGVSRYVKTSNLLPALDSKNRDRFGVQTSEERARQKILIGWLLDQPDWLVNLSRRLIIRGSRQWTVDADGPPIRQALWWNLSDDLEVELICRRDCVVETINSLQVYVVKLYTSKERQCKLGYDSSPQCDSFQLGEMIRFFNRIGTLRMQSTIYDIGSPEPGVGDIEHLIVLLRQCPQYQIDRNHTHCGIRTRLIPALDIILALIGSDVGICRQCWVDDRANYRWSEQVRAGAWTVRKGSTRSRRGRDERGCKVGHAQAKALFTASSRDWTSEL